MKYLIVMPKKLASIDHFNIFPIGMAYVSSSMKQAGYEVFTANLEYMEGDTFSLLSGLIQKNNIDVVCTGGLSRDCNKLKEVFDFARRIKPDIITVAGGGIISSDPEPAMRVLDADFGVIGEGEITMCELAHALDNGLKYDGIPGLIFKDSDGVLITTQERKEIEDLGSIPLPDFEGFNYGQWIKQSGSGLVVTDRSCPFRCTFCFHPSGKKYRHRSLDSIIEEMEYQMEHYGVRSFGLNTELFATKKQRIIDFCERIKKFNITWGLALRVPEVEPELLQIMKDAGCASIVLGLESADNSVLKSMRKGITVEQIERALEYTYEANLMIEAGFIFGDINETRETVENTLDFWRRHTDKHYLNLTMIYVFPGSYLYQYACEKGIIKDREQFLRDECPLINVSRLSDTEYNDLVSRISELRLHPHVPSKEFQIRSIKDNNECEIEYVCRKCGRKTGVKVNFWFGMETRCPDCTMTNFIDPFQKANHLGEVFFQDLDKDETVALWGAGGIYYKLYQKYKDLDSEKFLLVDSNSKQHGLTVCNKKVLPPAVIFERNIKTVIITALSRQDEILAFIESNYPNVENIFLPGFNIIEEEVVPLLKPAGTIETESKA